jgi:hypothetical protein
VSTLEVSALAATVPMGSMTGKVFTSPAPTMMMLACSWDEGADLVIQPACAGTRDGREPQHVLVAERGGERDAGVVAELAGAFL